MAVVAAAAAACCKGYGCATLMPSCNVGSKSPTLHGLPACLALQSTKRDRLPK